MPWSRPSRCCLTHERAAYLECGRGWRKILEVACNRIETALADGGHIQVEQVTTLGPKGPSFCPRGRLLPAGRCPARSTGHPRKSSGLADADGEDVGGIGKAQATRRLKLWRSEEVTAPWRPPCFCDPSLESELTAASCAGAPIVTVQQRARLDPALKGQVSGAQEDQWNVELRACSNECRSNRSSVPNDLTAL